MTMTMTHEDFESVLGDLAQRLKAACDEAILTELSVEVRFASYLRLPEVHLMGAEAGQLARNLGHLEPTPSDHPHGWYAFTPGWDGRIRPQRHYRWETEGVAYVATETTDDLGIHGEELQALIDEYHDHVEARQEAELRAEL